ncbi:MAG: hypothetical protein APF76_09175 [Desulfitibacter sp. BRH_c19]|nr:MAG: hypothetical protein APF76_09175 [Desulfitibacter sp. BRH_c19]
MKKTWMFNITIVCTILGLLLSWQYKSTRAEADSSSSILHENIIEMIQQLETDIHDTEEEIGTIRNQLSQYQEVEDQDAGTLKFLQDYLHLQRSINSLTTVVGPGITITLDDNVQGAASASTDFASFRPEDYIIHDKTVLYLVNELKAAGAKAIAINNQRLVSSSDIRCVGTVILVNTTPMAPPYQIKALGDPEEIKEKLLLGDEIPYLKARNFPVKIEVGEVEIPEYKGNFRQSHLERGEQIHE